VVHVCGAVEPGTALWAYSRCMVCISLNSVVKSPGNVPDAYSYIVPPPSLLSPHPHPQPRSAACTVGM
jgi:hypothetical protein